MLDWSFSNILKYSWPYQRVYAVMTGEQVREMVKGNGDE